ncbi:MAG: outer membrane beta-barrel protein [Verrucomicrobia bacterium]|nr:outer membrane beta-barrel protein [Verrucomicrobiota bacterium]
MNNNNTGTTEWRGGLLLDSHISSKTFLRFGAIYSRVKYNNADLGEWDRWSALAQIHYHFSESLIAALTYRYQTRKSTVVGDSYDENLVVLTLTKRFDAPQRGVDVTDE